MKRLISVVLSVAVWVMVWGVTSGAYAEDAGDTVNFNWAFGIVENVEGGGYKLTPVKEDMAAYSKDRFRMMVELQTLCYVYVYYRSPGDDVKLLFPYDLAQFSGDYETSKKYYIPSGNWWNEFDENTGLETFYVLASKERLRSVEDAYEGFLDADSDQKQSAAKDLFAAIRTERRKHKTLTARAERPVIIGGNVRGNPPSNKDDLPDVSTIAVEISAPEFYSRTFSIEHKER